MESYEQLDSALKFLSSYKESMTLTAPEICKKYGLDIDEYTAGLLVDKLHDENYVRRMDGTASRYQPRFNGELFINNDGYTFQHNLYKPKKSSQWFSDFF